MDRIEFLEKQLERVNSWLNFAEAKNAAIIAFNVAILSVEIDIYQWGQYIIYIGLLISSAFALYSFCPNIKNNGIFNGLLYADIVKLDNYLEYISEHYEKNNDELEKHLSDEIMVNSRITVRKYNLFKKAIYIDFFTVLFLIVMLVVA